MLKKIKKIIELLVSVTEIVIAVLEKQNFEKNETWSPAGLSHYTLFVKHVVCQVQEEKKFNI